MPELPEVERARQAIEAALDREIRAVDDTDEWVCRPHRPGDIARALVGGRLVAAHRRGKTMWCDTVAADGEPGPHLGIHLGMGGWIVVDGADGEHVGGEPFRPEPDAIRPEWQRFSIDFADGGRLRLLDKRRLGRVRLEPDLDGLGPDALAISADEFRERVGRGKAPVKARLQDQGVLAGVGNLLADELLWQARISPRTPVDQLGPDELDRLYAAMRRTIEAAIADGGAHTGEVIPFRKPGAACPRCGAPMEHGRIGGRTTWWCSAEQA
ncbi:MAG TPA: DNA-formamidopyrimidine glycosylase family protein [Pseudonocardia sp.]|uniref:DNA-formamidopyrimidine glycosylase family protein n=1 Tax=Pseudonocardia sp. TaxID=60912 RepID=UPI002B4AFA2E|nr:DNA-formamidopyrimidine glycosylase family protein [Pseudonocardia sp.]HLU55444.1 DNA-formamidopyrimidine glycosylase family protein [Pseudonocardia sp.]